MKNKIVDFLLWTILAIVLGLFASFMFLPLLGENPFQAFQVMIQETFADTYTMGNILIKTTPLILTALAFAFTYKANLFNIGAQGQFYMGCIFAVATTLTLQNRVPGVIVIVAAMIASILGGGITGFIIGLLKAKWKANEFLVSMMSSYVVIYLMSFLLRTVLREDKKEYLQTNYIDKTAWLPKLIKGTSVSWGFVIALAVAILIWFVLYKTTLGYRIRVMGYNQEAAKISGITPEKQCMLAFTMSGALAGLAGFVEINGMQHMLLTGFDTDIGSYGIGIAIMANANPIGIIFAALLFGTLKVGGTALGHATSVPSSVIDLMEGFVMLFVLVSFFIRKELEKKKIQNGKIEKAKEEKEYEHNCKSAC